MSGCATTFSTSGSGGACRLSVGAPAHTETTHQPRIPATSASLTLRNTSGLISSPLCTKNAVKKAEHLLARPHCVAVAAQRVGLVREDQLIDSHTGLTQAHRQILRLVELDVA